MSRRQADQSPFGESNESIGELFEFELKIRLYIFGALLASPSPDDPRSAGEPISLQGWAWAQSGVARVEVSTDAGETWIPAMLNLAAILAGSRSACHQCSNRGVTNYRAGVSI
jgi:hypothetical protein